MTTPAWVSQLRQGSFRGVPFFTHGHQARMGRKTITHEFPLRDTPEPEDLGASARRFTIEMFVIGDNYMPARDALEAALTKGGIARLVHPWRGEMDVMVEGDFPSTETTRQGGYCCMSVTFVRASTKTYPTAVVDTQSASKTAATAAIAQAQTQFAKKFSLAAAAGFVVQSALAQMQTVTTTLSNAANTIQTLPAEAATLVGGISQMSSGLSSLILSPGELAQSIVNLVGQLQLAAANPEAAYQAMKLLFGFSPAAPGPTTTPARIQEEDNRAEIGRLVSRVAVFSAAATTADIDYASYDDALNAQNALQDQFDALAADVDDPDLYDALVESQTATGQDITTRGLQLPRLSHIVLPDTAPALRLAWMLYQDASRADSIADRNKLNDPLFLPGGVSLEVLTS